MTSKSSTRQRLAAFAFVVATAIQTTPSLAEQRFVAVPEIENGTVAPRVIHTSIRGGITGGSTEYNPSSRLGTSVWVSLFPYLSDDSRIIELRNGDTYSRQEALSYAGAMLAHEMGHQLFQLGHPWSNPACFMRPAEALDFASWVKRFDAKTCPIESSPAMMPGAIEVPIW